MLCGEYIYWYCSVHVPRLKAGVSMSGLSRMPCMRALNSGSVLHYLQLSRRTSHTVANPCEAPTRRTLTGLTTHGGQ